MSRQLLSLPTNIPWKLIAVSPDMMDKRFCNQFFPYAWRSSLAISAYEPRREELPEELCEGRITYLKVTCTITGYQPSEGETNDANNIPEVLAPFSGEATEDFRDAVERITADYFACYGSLLNVAVFPAKIEKEFKPTTINFARLNREPDTILSNPFVHDGVEFEAEDQPNNRLVDIYEEGGDGNAELDIFIMVTIKLPLDKQIEKVTAEVVHYSAAGITMMAFKGSETTGSVVEGVEQGVLHELTISDEDNGIDRVILKAPENKASLLKFTYYVVEEQTTRTDAIDLKEYPHIIDFEPKTRDLYQSATETGEVLTGSKSGVKTDKSFTHTESTQDSFSLTQGISVPIPGTPVTSNSEAKLSRTNTDTDQDHWAVSTDASRERRETNATATQLSQMYNLLTGYHAGTNRAVFLMLARPHTLQPTDHRTFVQGLRHIEGIQEFFLIVARPGNIEGLCVEAFLETGHFPEGTPIEVPDEEYEESSEEFTAKAFADNGWLSGSCSNIEDDETSTYSIDTNWIVDRREKRMRQADQPVGSGWEPRHPGVAEIENNSNSQANSSLERYDYRATSDVSAGVFGTVCGQSAQRDKARFNRTYRVFTRKEQPRSSDDESEADIDNLLITRRGLCVCFKSGDCPEIVPLPEPPIVLSPGRPIVEEPMVRIRPALLTRTAVSQSRAPAMKEFLKQVEKSLLNSWRSPKRYPLEQVGFLESDFFKNRLTRALPGAYLKTLLSQIRGLPKEVIKAFGNKETVADALKLDLVRFARKTGLTIEGAGAARRVLFGLTPKPDDGNKPTPGPK
jgi:hypothetical protein